MQSRVETILQAIIDGTSVSELDIPQSRNEALLMGVLGRINALPIEDAQRSAEAAAASAAEALRIVQSIPLDYSVLSNSFMLTTSEIPGTTQTVTMANGAVTAITHTDDNDDTVRTDTFTIGESTIVETRTLSTGESMTITTYLTTLATTVVYSDGT